MTLKYSLDLLINVLSYALFYTYFAIQYISFSINNKSIKDLLEQVQRTYNKLIDKNEISIMEKYSTYAKRYTIAFSLIVIFVGITLIFYIFWPQIFDILFPINGTWSHSLLPLMTEYFIDQEKYFYLILFHATIAFIIGALAALAIGTILIVCYEHACGMFRIASYRIERAMEIQILKRKNSLEKKNLIYKKLICAVVMHRNAIEFSEMILSKVKVMMYCMLLDGMITTSINLFRTFQMISYGFKTMELFLHVIFCIIDFTYIIIINYFGQKIIDNNNKVFVTVYDVQWYVAPLQVQKMILFLLQRSNKTFTMNIDGLMTGSLENAASLLSAAVSYFAILHSTQN
ncbi:odorant receptor 63a [Monomorium pharaonis]|uniref:odorant receptor 63a n=1 Tax=Monomorium pharaonis TaxID=307658 RepID=UPI0017463208|nr:odorant receptor 63a [Monomorium pharaonis]